jgi:NhaP-type Na+/H+ or K+/H+ antiporter
MRAVIEIVVTVLLILLPFWVYPLLWLISQDSTNKHMPTRRY